MCYTLLHKKLNFTFTDHAFFLTSPTLILTQKIADFMLSETPQILNRHIPFGQRRRMAGLRTTVEPPLMANDQEPGNG